MEDRRKKQHRKYEDLAMEEKKVKRPSPPEKKHKDREDSSYHKAKVEAS